MPQSNVCNIPRDPEEGRDITRLTEFELDILRLVAQGLSNEEVGLQLDLAEKTVRNRLTGIFKKLRVTNRVQAVLYALRHDLASLDEKAE